MESVDHNIVPGWFGSPSSSTTLSKVISEKCEEITDHQRQIQSYQDQNKSLTNNFIESIQEQAVLTQRLDIYERQITDLSKQNLEYKRYDEELRNSEVLENECLLGANEELKIELRKVQALLVTSSDSTISNGEQEYINTLEKDVDRYLVIIERKNKDYIALETKYDLLEDELVTKIDQLRTTKKLKDEIETLTETIVQLEDEVEDLIDDRLSS